MDVGPSAPPIMQTVVCSFIFITLPRISNKNPIQQPTRPNTSCKLRFSYNKYRIKISGCIFSISLHPLISLRSFKCDSLLHPVAFRFIQLLHQRIFKSGKSRNKTITYQQNHFVYFIFIIYMDRSISFF